MPWPRRPAKADWYRGLAAEYKAQCLQAASLAGATLAGIITKEAPPNLALDRFTTIRKAPFHLDQETKIEIGLAVSEPDGIDLMVEFRD